MRITRILNECVNSLACWGRPGEPGPGCEGEYSPGGLVRTGRGEQGGVGAGLVGVGGVGGPRPGSSL